MPKKSATNIIHVGTFTLGNLDILVQVDLTLEGGHYQTRPGQPVITIGFDKNNFGDICGVLLHEALEMSHGQMGNKYRKVPMSNFDSADLLFSFDHAQFGRACSDVGHFMADVMPALAKAYKKHKGK